MRRARTSCLIVSAACGAAELLSAQTATFARLYPDNLVQLLDLKQNSWRTIHKSPAWSTTALSVGPTGDRVALLSWTKGTVAGHDYVEPPAPELIVIDTAGRVAAPGVAQVQRYAWCGARCIVFLTGQYEESHYGFRPRGVGVLDIETGKTRSLPSPTTPIGITWASFDSAAYVKNLPRRGEAYIYRLELPRGTLVPTELEDHRFSPSGRYYLLDGEFTDTVVVYETRTNKPVDIEGFRRGAIVLGWVSPREDLLLAVRRPPPRSPRAGRRRPRPRDPNEFQPYLLYMVYDLAAGRVRDTVTGHLKEWSGSGNLRLVERDGKYHRVGAR